LNYLAHLYLAQPNADSHFGNLLGDFGGIKQMNLPSPVVLNGLNNHYLVDKFTDSHPEVKRAKRLFSDNKRRFAGIALDVLFDHFLIRHWSSFHHKPFEHFKQNSYRLLNDRLTEMPSKMQIIVRSITTNDWFDEYRTVEGIGLALDNIAKRIRFANKFTGSIEDIHKHYDELEEVFLAFFPQLITHVNQHGLEVHDTGSNLS